jgi:large subunit ribosomal protein L23
MANPLEQYYRIVRRPRVTEKGLRDVERRRAYAFEVASDANKVEIRKAVEALFSVKVEAVRTMNMIGKAKRMGRFWGRRPAWKKAIVKLREGHAIEDFY